MQKASASGGPNPPPPDPAGALPLNHIGGLPSSNPPPASLAALSGNE